MKPFLTVVAIAVAAVTALATAQPVRDEIVLPSADGRSGFCAPFGCDTRIQQVFDAFLFPGHIRIDTLMLLNDVPHSAEAFIEPARYQFFLSTTSASSASIGADFDANYRGRPHLVAEFLVADFNTGWTGALVLPLSKPFMYNPRAGNLLLEIRKDQTGNFGDGPIYVDGSTNAPGVTLVTESGGVQRHMGFSVVFVGTFHGRSAAAPAGAPLFRIPSHADGPAGVPGHPRP